MRRLPLPSHRATLLALAAWTSACASLRGGEPVPERPGDVARAALPGVVLLVTTRPDGRTGFGAGLLVGNEDLVLTNLHVVADATSVRALLYRPDRTSYTPMDGGLSRYLFEHEDELLPARVIRTHEALDVAVIRVDGDTRGLPRLPLSTEPVHPGDRVYALGHPSETVWSFTSGVVSAIHQGAIQHDATLNPGSSGGPLLDEEGRVIGINTLKVMQGGDRLGFARPIALVRPVVEEASGQGVLDLTSLRMAVTSCFRAQELATYEAIDCIDWGGHDELFRAAVANVAGELAPTPEGRRALDDALHAVGDDAWWDRWFREGARAWFLGKPRDPKDRPRLRPPGEAFTREKVEPRLCETREKLHRLADAQMERQREAMGFKGRPEDNRAMKEVLRMGLRIELVDWVEPEREAWVRLVGRNADGTLYRLSERWSLRGDAWHQHWPPTPKDLESLPAGWPPPWDDYAERRVQLEAMVLAMLHPDPRPDLCGAAMGRSGVGG